MSRDLTAVHIGKLNLGRGFRADRVFPSDAMQMVLYGDLAGHGDLEMGWRFWVGWMRRWIDG